MAETKRERVRRISRMVGELEAEHAGECPGHPELAGVVDYVRTVSGFDQFRCRDCSSVFHRPVPEGAEGYKAGAAELQIETGG